MWLLLVIFFIIYFLTGLIKNILYILEYIDKKDKQLDEKYPYRKKLQE